MIKLMGFDTKTQDWYSLGNFSTEEAALREATQRIKLLEDTPEGGRHQVFIKYQDGSQRRVAE